MGTERMACCGALTKVYSDAGNRQHNPGCRYAHREGDVSNKKAETVRLALEIVSGEQFGDVEVEGVPVPIRSSLLALNDILESREQTVDLIIGLQNLLGFVMHELADEKGRPVDEVRAETYDRMRRFVNEMDA